ncbi:MAG: electron transfer flavoprotein subunit alpha/FixB family protein, partial [Neisseriaceae bacterium]|nr:electron transfer flavoprotein subunit alpha/FixB family protein [Neisseriaceae bacterium]
MSVLIIAELVENTLAPAVLNAVTAAQKLGDVDVLVASDSVSAVADAVKSIAGVRKVITAEAAHFANALAEEIAPQAVALAANYDIIAAASTAAGKNLLPRVAALLDVPMISDVTEVIDGDTFVHPVYAGNAFETVKVSGKKVLTFRATAFDAAVKEGGSAAVE